MGREIAARPNAALTSRHFKPEYKPIGHVEGIMTMEFHHRVKKNPDLLKHYLKIRPLNAEIRSPNACNNVTERLFVNSKIYGPKIWGLRNGECEISHYVAKILCA